MKQQILSIAFCLLIGLSVQAQSTGMAFAEVSTWEEVLKQAAEEDKLIFMDAYAVWCGPCKAMTNEVFTDKEVGDFYNKNFINVKVDMERGQGPGLAKEYGVRAYPTLLFINGKGELIHQGLGYHASDDFIELGETAMNPDNNMSGLEARYAAGDRSPEFLYDYTMLRYGMMDGSHKKVAEEYLATQKNWNTPDNMAFIMRFTEDKDSEMFSHLATNREAYEQLFGKDQIIGKIQTVLVNSIPRGSEEAEVFKVVDEVYEQAYPERGEELSSRFRLLYYRQARDMEKFAPAAIEHYNTYSSEDWSELNEMAWNFYETVDDPAQLKVALAWAEKSVNLNENYYNLDTLAWLYYKLGEKGKARKTAKKAIALGEESGEDVTYTEELLEKL